LNVLLIAGTDTETGKTVLTCALAAYWQTYRPQESLGILKPIQTGISDNPNGIPVDGELYQKLFDLSQTPEEITPLRFQTPVAPPVAAEREGRRVELEPVWQAFDTLRRQRDFVLVEALGGLGSPITHELTVADLARDWRLPVVLVVPVKLGAIRTSCREYGPSQSVTHPPQRHCPQSRHSLFGRRNGRLDTN
jgi:dethiobiotin synthetase